MNITDKKVILSLLSITRKVNSITKMSKRTDTTFAHTSKIANWLSDKNLIHINRDKRETVITLTPNGNEVKHLYNVIVLKIKEKTI